MLKSNNLYFCAFMLLVSPAVQADNVDVAPDCVGYVREQRDLAAEAGVTLSRTEQKTLLLDCRNSFLADRIAAQEATLDTLRERMSSLDLRLDEQAQIIDENNQVITHIIVINGQLTIQRLLQDEIAASESEIAAMLAKAERILQTLAIQ